MTREAEGREAGDHRFSTYLGLERADVRGL